MPIESGTISVGANSTSANVLNGTPLGLLTGQALAKLEASQAGAASSDITARYQSGFMVHCDGAPVNVNATGQISGDGTDTIFKGEVVTGQQQLRFTNTTAGALVVAYKVTISA